MLHCGYIGLRLFRSPRASSWVVHGYPFEDAANAKIVAHLIGLLRRMV